MTRYNIKRTTRSGAGSLESTADPERVRTAIAQAYRDHRPCKVTADNGSDVHEIGAVWTLNNHWVWYLDEDQLQ